MSELSTRSAMQGALQGYQFVDNEFDEARQQKMQRTALEDNREFRDKSFETAQQNHTAAFEESKRHNAAIEGLREQQNGRSNAMHQLQMRKQKQSEVDKELSVGWKMYLQGKPIDPDLERRVKEVGLGYKLPSAWADEKHIKANLGLLPAVEAVKNGNLDTINSPEILQAINAAYSDQIKKGVGEFISPLGKTITDKEIAGYRSIRIKPGEKARVVPMIKVTYNDGSTNLAPMTALRSSSKDDQVALLDPKTLVEDALGRIKMAKAMSTPEAREHLAKIHSNIYGSDPSQQYTPQSATGKTIQDLMAFGVSQERAVEISTLAKDNPRQALIEMTSDIMGKEGWEKTPEEAVGMARQALSQIYPESVSEGGGALTPVSLPESLQGYFERAKSNPANQGIPDDQIKRAIIKQFGSSAGG